MLVGSALSEGLGKRGGRRSGVEVRRGVVRVQDPASQSACVRGGRAPRGPCARCAVAVRRLVATVCWVEAAFESAGPVRLPGWVGLRALRAPVGYGGAWWRCCGPRGGQVAASLYVAWRDAQWRQLARRRADMASVPWVDHDATRGELWRERPPDRAGAFRTILLGGGVPQAGPQDADGCVSALRCHRDVVAPHMGVPPLVWAAAGAEFGPPAGAPAGLAATGAFRRQRGPVPTNVLCWGPRPGRRADIPGVALMLHVGGGSAGSLPERGPGPGLRAWRRHEVLRQDSPGRSMCVWCGLTSASAVALA